MLKGTQYIPDPVGVCPEGLPWVTIRTFTIIGNKNTQYGPKKDVVRFDLRVNVDGKEYKIDPDYPLSINAKSNFRKLLVALKISPDSVATGGLDLNDLVGRAFNGHVYHRVAGNVTHVGIIPLPPPPHACPCGKATLAGKDYCGGNCKWSIDAQTPVETCSYLYESGDKCYTLATGNGLCTAHGGVPCQN